MTTHTLRHHQASQSGLARWIGTGALAGALSVIVFHQTVAALLFGLGITERMPYSTQPSAPFGVPQLWSIAFWGGLWGIATGLLVNAAWGLGTGLGLALLAATSLRARPGQGGERARRIRFLP